MTITTPAPTASRLPAYDAKLASYDDRLAKLRRDQAALRASGHHERATRLTWSIARLEEARARCAATADAIREGGTR